MTNTQTRPYGQQDDGSARCINAQPGTYGHECGKPATWIGAMETGWQACYCVGCKAHGFEARAVKDWRAIAKATGAAS
jgi:hypothetical protein